jgi:hypothetical protein
MGARRRPSGLPTRSPADISTTPCPPEIGYLLCGLPNLAKNAPEIFFERGESLDQFGGIELANQAGARDTAIWVIRKMGLKGSFIQHRDAPLPI